MHSKYAVAIVQAMAAMCGMHKLYVCIIWNTDFGRELKYTTLLPVRTRRTCESSFKGQHFCSNPVLCCKSSFPSKLLITVDELYTTI